MRFRTSYTRGLLLFAIVLAGCGAPNPGGVYRSLSKGEVCVANVRLNSSVVLLRNDWSAFVTANEIKSDEQRLNKAMGMWQQAIMAAFSRKLVDDLRSAGLKTTAESEVGSCGERDSTRIRTYLEVGFVYRTINSSTFAPFAIASVGLAQQGVARPTYLRTYRVSNRSLGLLFTTERSETSYELKKIDSDVLELSSAKDALGAISVQIARQIASGLLIRPPA